MATFIYAPDITVRIRTHTGEIYDVSADVARATVRRATGVSSVSVTLLNGGGKYDGVFSPMDQIIVHLRRVRRLLVFSGYLNQVPVFQTYSGSVQITASCTLKRVQYYYWDPTTTAAHEILDPPPGGADQSDAGLSDRILEVLTKVVGWPEGQVHIGAVPEDWMSQIKKIGSSVVEEAERNAAANAVSSGMIAGKTPLRGGKTSKTPLAGQESGTGKIPAPNAEVRAFGGAKSSRVGEMELTGEPRRLDDTKRARWGGQFYIQMRWPYRTDTPGGVDDSSPKGSQSKVDVKKCQQWWAKQRLVVVNEKTGKGVVVRCADWGPSSTVSADAGLSAAAMRAIGAKSGDSVRVVFAENNAATLGKVTPKSKGVDAGLRDGIANFGKPVITGGSSGSVSSGGSVPPSSPGMQASGQKMDRNTVYSYALRAGFSQENAKIMTAVATGESGLDLNILGDTTIQTGTWGPSVGLFQIRTIKAETGKGTTRDINALMNNPSKQAASAYQIWKEAGGSFRPWSVYTSGAYKSHLGGSLSQVSGLTNAGGGPSQSAQFVDAVMGALKNKPSYVYGATPKASEKKPKSFDCSSLVQWAAAQIGVTTIPRVAADQYAAGKDIPIEEALRTPGALLFVGKGAAITHVAISGGDGRTTLEARSKRSGVGKFSSGLRFDCACLLNDIDYLGASNGGMAGGGGDDQNLTKNNFADALFNAYDWFDTQGDYTGEQLGGIRRLMNDVPVYGTIDTLFSTGMRDWCSAPNGDIIGWFPDYFGHYGTAAKMIIQDIEILTPFSVVWSDDRMKTHVFVSGADSGSPVGAMSPMDTIRLTETAGIATVEQEELMQAILNIDKGEFADGAAKFLKRFGARPEMHPMQQITGPWQEFFFAVHHFTKQWSDQYTAQVEMTFMPELFPGMIAVFPTWGVQAYITDVTHEIDLGPGGGFRTNTTLTAWSTVGGMNSPIKGFPKGGKL